MIKARILQQVAAALRQAAPGLNGLAVDEAVLSGLRLERPRNADHGDYAVNVSFLARVTKLPPPQIAARIAAHLPPGDDTLSVSVLGGYLNFTVGERLLREALAGIVREDAPGGNDSLQTERILLEYVSANPTGPLHVGHGRWAALGDSLVRIFRHCGATVTPEFYINDFGFQMEKLAVSLWWRSAECLNEEGALLGSAPGEDFLQGRELPYPGEFVTELARALLQDATYRQAILEDWSLYRQVGVVGGSESGDINISDLPAWEESIKARLIGIAAPRLLADQRQLLDEMRVHFDVWTSEKRAMHESGAVARTLETLRGKDWTYSEEGALWFRSEAFGDEKNRVLQKTDGSYTYLTADIAYHHDKFLRRAPDGQPYTRILNIWGADHHGYIARLRGAIAALGHDPERFEVLLGQLVNLVVDGERTRMGKRRRMLTLRDVVDEVGVDATRFWMVSKSADSTLDFDVDLAASASSENPVFYVQYAHARCCSIIRNATESAPNVDTGEIHPPAVDSAAFERDVQVLTPDALALLFDSLPSEGTPSPRVVLKTLLLRLDSFEETVKDAARLRAPHFLTQYMMDLAAQFHSFYGVCRIITPDADTTRVRLILILAIRKTLAQALDLLGVSAPERM
jgi:arginyl-tRNA synthetase